MFEDALEVPPRETVTREEVIEYRGRYRVEGRLDDGATDEYVVDPPRSLRSLLVWIEGELGHFRVLAVGSGP